jgi:hypothetical protein
MVCATGARFLYPFAELARLGSRQEKWPAPLAPWSIVARLLDMRGNHNRRAKGAAALDSQSAVVSLFLVMVPMCTGFNPAPSYVLCGLACLVGASLFFAQHLDGLAMVVRLSSASGRYR